MPGTNCDFKTHGRNLGYPLRLQIGRPKATFLGRLRNLTATLTAYIFGMKHDIDNRSSALATTPTSSQNVMDFGPQTDSNWTAILPTLCKFCFLRHCRRRSANRTQPHALERIRRASYTFCENFMNFGPQTT